METIFNVHAAKTHLSKLIRQAEAGEEIIIAQNKTPVARLTAYHEPRRTTPREFGKWKGSFSMTDDCFAPDSDMEALFYDSALFPKGRA